MNDIKVINYYEKRGLEKLSTFYDLMKQGNAKIGEIKKTPGTKCPRCWKYIKNKPEDVVCPRCFFIMLKDYCEYLTDRDFEWYKRRDKIYLETGKYPEQVEQDKVDEKYYKDLPKLGEEK